jgi:type II secretory pathway pseudopilin PulG
MNQKAMALVEIVVSMLVLAVAALAVTSTISLVNSSQMRSAGGSSLDLQAASYARETLELLKNAVSTKTGAGETGEPLKDVSYTAPCMAAEGEICGTETPPYTEYTQPELPASDLRSKGGVRVYKVWDISSGTRTLGTDVAYKKVTVTVTWRD